MRELRFGDVARRECALRAPIEDETGELFQVLAQTMDSACRG
jgi:hypothetical protein